jgi:hypothetical protein
VLSKHKIDPKIKYHQEPQQFKTANEVVLLRYKKWAEGLSLLKKNADDISSRVWFIPLVDHYNTHNSDWLGQQTTRAGLADAVVLYDLVHTDDYVNQKHAEFVNNFPHANKYWITVNQSDSVRSNSENNMWAVSWNFMWNRFRAYYTETIPENLHLHHYAAGKYNLPVLDINQRKSKKFLSLCGREFGYRTNVYNLVNEHAPDGYISNRSRNIFLEGSPVVGAFSPVPNMFYTDSVLSVYVESNFTSTELIHITEKTFDPLVKGHFILPFSNPGTIDYIKYMGFMLPDFIDYSYDREQDPAVRFKMFSNEFKRLMQLDLKTLWYENFSILEHNQKCLQTIPYDTRILIVYDI